MKRIAKLFCLIVLLFETRGFANSYEPCFNWCNLSYSVYADYLYWKVTRPAFSVSFLQSAAPTNTVGQYANPKYSSGYRVGADIFYNCFDFNARYSALGNTFDMIHRTNALAPTNNFRDLSYHLDYRTLDLAIGYSYFFQCYKGYVKPYVGAKLAWLDEHTTNFLASSAGTASNTVNDNNTKAYGLLFGVESGWQLFYCCVPVSLIARADLSILNSTTHYNIFVVPSGSPSRFNNGISDFIFVPDFFLGLQFDICGLRCFDANIQLGYEAQIWSSINAINGAPTVLSLGGLVAHFNVSF